MERVSGVVAQVKTKATTTDPVCGLCSLQKATMGVAIFNLIFAGISLIYVIVIAIFFTSMGVAAGSAVAEQTDEDGQPSPENRAAGTGIAVFATIISVIMIVLFAAILAFAVLLYKGAKNREYSKVRLWLIVSVVCSVIVVIDALAGLTSFFGFILVVIKVIIIAYIYWIVYAFLHEIDPDTLAGRLDGPGDFQGIQVNNSNEVQFSKNPYEGTQQQPPYAQPDPYGWDN